MNESSSDRLYLKLHFLEGAVLRVLEQNKTILKSINDLAAQRTTDSAPVPGKESKRETSPAQNPSPAITATTTRFSDLFRPIINPAMATPLAAQVLPSSVGNMAGSSAANQLVPISAPVTSLPRSDKPSNLFGFLPSLFPGLGTLATDSGFSTRVTSSNPTQANAPTIFAPSTLPGGQVSPAVSKPERQFSFTLSWTKGSAKRPSSDDSPSSGKDSPLVGRLNTAPRPTSCEPPVAKKANTETSVGSDGSDTPLSTGNLNGSGEKSVVEVVRVEDSTDTNPKDAIWPTTDKPTPASGSGSSGVVSPRRTPEGKTGAPEKVATFSFAVPVQPSLRTAQSGDIETVLFSNTTKLRRFVKSLKYFGVGSWQDRGVGVIRILQDTTNPSKIRVSMLRKRDSEVLCNHWITKGLPIYVYRDDPKHLRWNATEFPEDHRVNNVEGFICEFKDIGQANEFRKQFQKAVAICTAALSNRDSSLETEQIHETDAGCVE